MTAVTHASPATDLAEVSILGAPEREFRFLISVALRISPEREFRFLISVALRISASFREKLAMQAWTAQQEIPVVIPTSYSRIYKNSDLIREAFFTVQTRVSWESCWVKAISNAPKTPDACLWIDSHPLYEEGASAWGKVIDSRSPGGLVGAASQLVALGTDGHCVHLATTSDGQAFLVLPGGFVIKGQLALTPEERGYILARHGIRGWCLGTEVSAAALVSAPALSLSPRQRAGLPAWPNLCSPLFSSCVISNRICLRSYVLGCSTWAAATGICSIPAPPPKVHESQAVWPLDCLSEENLGPGHGG